MYIVRNRKIFYIISGAIVALAVAALFVVGFNLGIDFKGGTIIEVAYPDGRPLKGETEEGIRGVFPESFVLRPTGENQYALETRELSQSENQAILNALSRNETVGTNILRINNIGPVIGKGLLTKAYIALALIIISVILFVAFAFRHVSKPVSSWKYGFATIFALAHDVIVPAGLYVIYSRFTGAEIDLLFVTAILAILGYSINDTIVVFDRVRENLKYNQDHKIKEPFETTVGKSLDQTLVRSINTSMTLFLVLLGLYFFGSSTTEDFIFVLLIGTIAGTYSSIFLAAPFLVTMEKMQRKKDI